MEWHCLVCRTGQIVLTGNCPADSADTCTLQWTTWTIITTDCCLVWSAVLGFGEENQNACINVNIQCRLLASDICIHDQYWISIYVYRPAPWLLTWSLTSLTLIGWLADHRIRNIQQNSQNILEQSLLRIWEAAYWESMITLLSNSCMDVKLSSDCCSRNIWYWIPSHYRLPDLQTEH